MMMMLGSLYIQKLLFKYQLEGLRDGSAVKELKLLFQRIHATLVPGNLTCLSGLHDSRHIDCAQKYIQIRHPYA